MNNFTYIAANLAEYYMGFRKHSSCFSSKDYMTNWDPVFLAAVLSDLSVYIKEGQLDRGDVVRNSLLGPAVGVFVNFSTGFQYDMAENPSDPFPKTELEYLTNLAMQVEFMIFSVEHSQFSGDEICNSILEFRNEIKRVINEVLNGIDPIKVMSMHDGITYFMNDLSSKKIRARLWALSIEKEISVIKKATNKTYVYSISRK